MNSASAELAEDMPEITVLNDPYSQGIFNGYGDSVQYQDPVSPKKFYMVYSYLADVNTFRFIEPQSYQLVTPTFGVETHLATSTDSGVTWKFTKRVFQASSFTDYKSSDIGVLNSETPSLTGYEFFGLKRFIGARLVYYQEARQFYQPDWSGWFIQIQSGWGDDPSVLSNSPSVKIGTSTTLESWKVDHRVGEIDSRLNNCMILNNPTVHYSKTTGRLLLATECLVFKSGGTTDYELSRIVLLSTRPTGNPATWIWKYDGILADQSTAKELAGSIGLTMGQPKLTLSDSGKTIVLMTIRVANNTTFGKGDLGCASFEIANILENPALKRDVNGKLVPLSYISGAGSCTYAGSENGIVFNTSEDEVRFRLRKSKIRIN